MNSYPNVIPAGTLVRPADALKQMDEILIGKRKACSSIIMSKEHGTKLTDMMLRYVFEDYLNMTPEEVRDKLTPVMLDRFRLRPFIHKRIACPAEMDSDTELQFIAFHLYPSTKNVEPFDLIIKVYMEILEKKRSKYPKGFFDEAEGECRAKILLKTMINEFLCPSSMEELYALFADDKTIIPILCAYALRTPVTCIYLSPLDYLHEALGRQGDEELYEHYSKIREESINNPQPLQEDA